MAREVFESLNPKMASEIKNKKWRIQYSELNAK